LGGAFLVFCLLSCAALKTLAKQLAVERRVKRAAQRKDKLRENSEAVDRQLQ
jgi:hypothetical protein